MVDNLNHVYSGSATPIGIPVAGYQYLGQAITTGSQAHYLYSVRVNLAVYSNSNVSIQIWEGGATSPSTLVETLGPQTLSTDNAGVEYEFFSLRRTELKASTRYWIVVCTDSSGDLDWLSTNSTTNFDTNAEGTLENAFAARTNDSSAWVTPGGISGRHFVRVQATESRSVYSDADSGLGTLRSALANFPEGSYISFEPAMMDGAEINLNSQLVVDRDLIIDGWTGSGETGDDPDDTQILAPRR